MTIERKVNENRNNQRQSDSQSVTDGIKDYLKILVPVYGQVSYANNTKLSKPTAIALVTAFQAMTYYPLAELVYQYFSK